MSNVSNLHTTVRALLAPGRGLLAADESLPTIGKRFEALEIPSTEESRRAYREMLFVGNGIDRYISGVILFDETIRQKTAKGVPFSEFLVARGMIPGIKVDSGTVSLANFPREKVTEGLDGLEARMTNYYSLGARFAKWRAVISIADGLPSVGAIEANAHALARYAAISQKAGLVPIVEPEVLMTGDHNIARCEEVTEQTLRIVFRALSEQRVELESTILKCGMILSGEDCPQQASDDEVAAATLRCFRRAVPAAIPGIVFLSGGQTDEEATRRLSAICSLAKKGTPWKLSFSFGRALQSEAMKTWGGDQTKVESAQLALLRHAEANSFALHDEEAS